MSEIWKSVTLKEFSKVYEVSSLGRVRNIVTGRILKPKVSRVGYERVTLCNKGYKKNISIHRLVALAFIPNTENKPTVNHKNEVKSDNRVENLEWATNLEQNEYGTRKARAIAHTDWKNRGIDYKSVSKNHDYSRQDMCNRKKTIAYRDGEVVGIFLTQKAASEACGVSRSKVSSCVTGKKKTVRGYSFKDYVNEEKEGK